MATPQHFAASFARTLDLFRDSGAKEEQKTQFRTLAGMLKVEGVTIAAEDGKLLVNDTSVDGDTLLQRLEFHSVKEIAIPPDPPLGEMFELLRALAAQPGEEDISSRLRASGATRVSVRMQTFVFGTPLAPPPSSPAPPSRRANPSPDAAAAPSVARDADDIPDIVRESTAQSSGFSPAAAATRSTGDLIAQLKDNPDGPHVGDVLAVLGRQLEVAMKTNRTTQVLTIVAGIVRAEQQVSDASRRRQYSIALKRMYSKALLEAIADVADHPTDREDALLVLRRAGEDGVEVLLDLLVAAPTIEERRGIFVALTGMKEGTDQLVHMLGHHQWFVVRNVAELAGELGLEEAVPALAQQLEHDDERVRKAVALALAKIGSSSAAEPLRRALRDILRRSDASKTDVICARVDLAFTARANDVTGTILVVAEEGASAMHPLFFVRLGGIKW